MTCARPLAFAFAGIAAAGCAALLPTPTHRLTADNPTPVETGAPPPWLQTLRDVRGGIHLHSCDSHDGTTPVATIARLAHTSDLDFIIVTDHNTLAAKSQERLTGRPLVLVGTELSTTAGHLLALAIDREISRDQPVERIIEAVHAQGGLAIAAHPTSAKKPWTRWDLPLDGLEIFDATDELRRSSIPWTLAKALILPNPLFWQTTRRRPATTLAVWDAHVWDAHRVTSRALVGIAGHDTHAHAGVGPFLVDSFQSGFHLVTTHVLVETLTPAAVYEGIRSGHCYVGFDGLAPTSSFWFAIQQARLPDGQAQRWTLMGDRCSWESGLTAHVHLPREGAITLVRNGRPIRQARGTEARWPIEQPGVYRVEVTLRQQLWILSNPIAVQPHGPRPGGQTVEKAS